MITKQDVEKVLSQYPTLNYLGFGVGNDQYRFYENIEEIEVVVNTLKNVRKNKHINKNTSSYGLKHWVEHKHNHNVYVSNGSFIIGAILSGFNVLKDSPNAYFNICNRDIKYEN
jgi:argininosuccinate synthase